MNWQKNSLFIVVIFINFLFSVHNLQAKMTVNHEKISVNYSIYKNLTLLKGQIISVELKSGKVYEGVVKSVSDKYLYIEKITNKEYYDGLIAISEIEAIVVRAR
ncbi:MAG TPA: hypothetical protein PK055_06055 [Gammaproteobacteria bacterium]|nr:hypothetical protein [Xanthomonadales bacterium]HOP22329.1 hypothetical protein [Gammaproteobacteria bacterium]HPI96080.1 hypothetical protein [Gammaproteobacteria bacterium]HPQ87199.1 hypothetical protein [Gammaproteobacteria bacterium]